MSAAAKKGSRPTDFRERAGTAEAEAVSKVGTVADPARGACCSCCFRSVISWRIDLTSFVSSWRIDLTSFVSSSIACVISALVS